MARMGATNLFPSLCPCVLPLIGSDTKIDDTEIILDKVLFCGDSEVRCETMGLKAGASSSARTSRCSKQVLGKIREVGLKISTSSFMCLNDTLDTY